MAAHTFKPCTPRKINRDHCEFKARQDPPFFLRKVCFSKMEHFVVVVVIETGSDY